MAMRVLVSSLSCQGVLLGRLLGTPRAKGPRLLLRRLDAKAAAPQRLPWLGGAVAAAAALGAGTQVAACGASTPGPLGTEAGGPRSIVLRVEGMSCNGCRSGVERALAAVDGVETASVELESKMARVSGTATAGALIAAVKKVGKRAELLEATLERFVEMTESELKTYLSETGQRGLVLDIDETLSATNMAWFQRLEEQFGNPEGIPLHELAKKYHLAQNVPFWQGEAALAWMQRQRDSPEAQDNLPLVLGAVEGVLALLQAVPVVGYCTVRPSAVNANTIAWLRETGFPARPVVAKPPDVPFADGNKWKAAALHKLWPEVTGIVDDNPKVPVFAGASYPGVILLFSHSECGPGYEHAVPCPTWTAVVETATRAGLVLSR